MAYHDLRSIIGAMWRKKQDLHTTIHSHDPHAQRIAERIAASLETTRQQLREWHKRQAKDLAQEERMCPKNPKPYKSLKHVDKVLAEKGHRGIRAVHFWDRTETNNPKVVTGEVLNSFKRQHNAEDGELSDYNKNLISHCTTVRKNEKYNATGSTYGSWMRCCTN